MLIHLLYRYYTLKKTYQKTYQIRSLERLNYKALATAKLKIRFLKWQRTRICGLREKNKKRSSSLNKAPATSGTSTTQFVFTVCTKKLKYKLIYYIAHDSVPINPSVAWDEFLAPSKKGLKILCTLHNQTLFKNIFFSFAIF